MFVIVHLSSSPDSEMFYHFNRHIVQHMLHRQYTLKSCFLIVFILIPGLASYLSRVKLARIVV